MSRSSVTHPLRIDEVACGSGVIGMTICPGKRGPSKFGGPWDRDLDLDIEAICAWRAEAVVTLMQTHELRKLGASRLGEAVEAQGLPWLHLPIADLGVPDAGFERVWTYSGHVIRTILSRGGRVLVHCRGGLGRTGLLAARLLIEFGRRPQEAVNAVRAARAGAIETPAQEARVFERAPVSGADRKAERILACLFGGAVGDAFGYAVEFERLAAIRHRFGPGGITEPIFQNDRLVVSDDTQMTLFTGDGLVRALSTPSASNGQITEEIRAAYLAWFKTQDGGSSRSLPTDGLQRFSELWARRAPGGTCLTALSIGGRGTPQRPINNSKGCGGVMRVAPIGLARALDADRAFELAASAAALTHGHPSGYLSAAVMAGIIRDLVEDDDLVSSLEKARARLVTQNGYEETLAAIDAAVRLEAGPLPRDEAIRALGEGWGGE